MKRIIVSALVLGIFTTCLIMGWQTGYLKAIYLLAGGKEIDTSNFPNRWERGKLLDPVIPEAPFITSYHIANNGTHTFKSYHVKLPPFGNYRTKWHRVPNEDWEDYEEWLNTPHPPSFLQITPDSPVVFTNVRIYGMRGVDPQALLEFMGFQIVPSSGGTK